MQPDFLHQNPVGVPGDSRLALEVAACALGIEAEQYGATNLPAGVLTHAAQIIRGLFDGDYAYLVDEAVSRAERRSTNA